MTVVLRHMHDKPRCFLCGPSGFAVLIAFVVLLFLSAACELQHPLCPAVTVWGQEK